MFVPQILRDAAGTIGESPLINLFGVWPDGSLITAHELVVYQMKVSGGLTGRFEVDWAQMDSLRGVSCFDSGGPRLGVVGHFENPRFFPNTVSPVVRIHPRGGLNTTVYPNWTAADVIPAAEITPNLTDLEVLGTGSRVRIRAKVDRRQYLTTRDVIAAELEFGQVVSGLEGSAVVRRTNGGLQLVGMLFNLVEQNGESFAYCHPAASI